MSYRHGSGRDRGHSTGPRRADQILLAGVTAQGTDFFIKVGGTLGAATIANFETVLARLDTPEFWRQGSRRTAVVELPPNRSKEAVIGMG